MKNIILITGIILLVFNLLFGSIITAYPVFNMLLNSGVIIATFASLYVLYCINLKDGFRISLSFLFGFLGIVEFVFGLFAPQQYENNWYLIAIIFIVAFEAIVLTMANIVSKKI